MDLVLHLAPHGDDHADVEPRHVGNVVPGEDVGGIGHGERQRLPGELER